MASKRSEDETDFTERDHKIALNAHFMEDSDIIEIKSPEYLKGKRIILKTSLISLSLVILPILLVVILFPDSLITFVSLIFSFLSNFELLCSNCCN